MACPRTNSQQIWGGLFDESLEIMIEPWLDSCTPIFLLLNYILIANIRNPIYFEKDGDVVLLSATEN